MTEPAGGFAHPAIWTMFHPPPTPTATENAGEGISGGAIAGAVVGSVAGVSLFGLGAWMLLRRRSQRRRRQSIGRSTISELQGAPVEVHEKESIPAEQVPVYEKAATPLEPINDEPQELEAFLPERQELPCPTKDAKFERKRTPSPRQSKFAENTTDEHTGESI